MDYEVAEFIVWTTPDQVIRLPTLQIINNNTFISTDTNHVSFHSPDVNEWLTDAIDKETYKETYNILEIRELGHYKENKANI